MITSDALISGLIVALLAVIIVAGVLLFAMQRIPPPAPAAAAAALTSLPEVNTYIDFYIKQLTEFRKRIDELEKMNKDLDDRADKLASHNHVLGEKLIAAYDQIERIYSTLNGTPAGAGWVQELRKTDPRNAPPPAG